MIKYQILLFIFLKSIEMNACYVLRNQIKKSSWTHAEKFNSRLYSKLPNGDNDQQVKNRHRLRQKEINEQLKKINIPNIDKFESAVQSSISGTYDNDTAFQFGSSAIKTYKSYIQSKHEEADIKVSALRTARQIEFLIKQHKSRTAEWVRHNDFQQQNHEKKDTNQSRFPIRLVLDNVRSAYNVGSIFRTADACNISEIITTGITPRPGEYFEVFCIPVCYVYLLGNFIVFNYQQLKIDPLKLGGNGWEKISKSSLGAELIVPTRHFDTTREVIDMFKNDGCMLVGMETTNLSKNYLDVTYQEDGIGTVIFLGNEVRDPMMCSK